MEALTEVKDGQLTSIKTINQILVNIKDSLNEINDKIEIVKYGLPHVKNATVNQAYDNGLNGLVGRAFNILGYVESINHSLDVLVFEKQKVS